MNSKLEKLEASLNKKFDLLLQAHRHGPSSHVKSTSSSSLCLICKSSQHVTRLSPCIQIFRLKNCMRWKPLLGEANDLFFLYADVPVLRGIMM